jgi:5-methylcytosine-specific restriction endonuclease McrA
MARRRRRQHHRGYGKLERTTDHLTPKSRGGRSILENVVACHRKCNDDKKDMTLEEYRIVIAARKGSPVDQFKFSGESHDHSIISNRYRQWQ